MRVAVLLTGWLLLFHLSTASAQLKDVRQTIFGMD